MSKTTLLIQTFESLTGRPVENITALPRSGSYREYYRLRSGEMSIIGVYNADRKENEAFVNFTKHFLSANLAVPAILAEDLDNNIYLLEDLGDTTLYSYLSEHRENGDIPEIVLDVYKRIVLELPHFQVRGNKGLEYDFCYPRSSFDKQSMMWDLNYFKYYFLKLAKVPFDEQELENDFQHFSDWLLEEQNDFFLYRDFQSRNIMIFHDKIYYIDYQGGRKGALQYDLASLLYDAKADIPEKDRILLINTYLDSLEELIDVDRERFIRYFPGFALIRLLQAMGAFGFRGFYEKKPHFLKSIPYALKSLVQLFDHHELPIHIPHLLQVLKSLPESPELRQFTDSRKYTGQLMVEINSFSYKRGIPLDLSENGGGFVFDCRAIHNPGRYEQYQKLTGVDPEVKEFLNRHGDANHFVENAYHLIEPSIKNYIDRNFTNLMINFGCTGGQHRSVFCAEKMKEILQNTFGDHIEITIKHREMELKKLGL